MAGQVLQQCKIGRAFSRRIVAGTTLPATFGAAWKVRTMCFTRQDAFKGVFHPFQSHCKMKYGRDLD